MRLQIVVQTLFPACTIGEPYSLNKGAMLVCVCERWMAVASDSGAVAAKRVIKSTQHLRKQQQQIENSEGVGGTRKGANFL